MMEDQKETNAEAEKKQKNEPSAMVWIGKGIATIAVWVGSCVLGLLGLAFLFGPIIGLIAGVAGTIAIWCPERLNKFYEQF